MSDAYYDYQPTHRLGKPLVLVSFVNELTRAVASSLASTTGLPLCLVDDVIEHRLGASSVKLLDSPGLAEWREVEKRETVRAVRARPSAVVALGEGALADDESLALVLAEAELVYLYLSFGEAKERFAQQAANRKATVLAELQGDTRWEQDNLLELFARRRAAYERAPQSIDVRGNSIRTITRQLMQKLEE